MKKILFFTLILAAALKVFAQNIPYTYKEQSINDDYFSCIFPSGNGDYTILLNQQDWFTQSKYVSKPSIIVVDSLGMLIGKHSLYSFQDSVGLHYGRMCGNGYMFYGAKNNDVYYEKRDSLLNVTQSKSINLGDSIINSYVTDVVQFDSFEVLIIWCQHIKDNMPRFCLLKISSSNLDTLGLFKSKLPGVVFNGIQHLNDKGLYVFTFLYNSCGYGQIISFDSSLNKISCDTIPKYLSRNTNAIWRADSTLLLSGTMEFIPDTIFGNNILYDSDMGLLIIDTLRNTLAARYLFNYGTKDYAGWGKNLIETSFGYYYTGVRGRVAGSNYKPTDIVLAKVDYNLNVIWEKRLTDSTESYDVSGIVATPDGGVLLLVWVFNPNASLLDRDAYVLKISKDGVLLNRQKVSSMKQTFVIFPNPTSQSINIALVANDQIIKEYQIFDLQGKLVLQKQIDAKQYKINVQSLARGVYIIEGVTNTGARFQSRFVKE